MFLTRNKQRISPLDDFVTTLRGSPDKWMWKGIRNCPRCGESKESFPPYSVESGPDGISATPICQRCWDELPAVGRFQWLLMLMAAWAAELRDRPDIDTAKAASDWSAKVERWYHALLK